MKASVGGSNPSPVTSSAFLPHGYIVRWAMTFQMVPDLQIYSVSWIPSTLKLPGPTVSLCSHQLPWANWISLELIFLSDESAVGCLVKTHQRGSMVAKRLRDSTVFSTVEGNGFWTHRTGLMPAARMLCIKVTEAVRPWGVPFNHSRDAQDDLFWGCVLGKMEELLPVATVSLS